LGAYSAPPDLAGFRGRAPGKGTGKRGGKGGTEGRSGEGGRGRGTCSMVQGG